MITRRDFTAFLSSLLAVNSLKSCINRQEISHPAATNIVISTWNNEKANQKALAQLIDNQADILSAVEYGINVVEEDENDHSVGIGGRPDRDGNVTLDACIMNSEGDAGSVTYLQNIVNAVSVARKVMEDTPHVLLSGAGAKKFALSKGFKPENLLTESSKKEYENWLKEAKYNPNANIGRHDTIGLLAMNEQGKMSGGCSTSGLSYKMAGRVGDSPIIGAGLFVDNGVGAATATGLGELVMKTCASFLVVELMRNGKTAQEACIEAIKRIADKAKTDQAQVGLIALKKDGEIGAFSLRPGFSYTLTKNGQHTVNEARSYLGEK